MGDGCGQSLPGAVLNTQSGLHCMTLITCGQLFGGCCTSDQNWKKKNNRSELKIDIQAVHHVKLLIFACEQETGIKENCG